MPPSAPTPLPFSGRLTALRRLAPSDLAAFQRYRRDPAVGLYQGWTAQSDQDAEDFLARMSRAPLFGAGDWTQIGITELGSNVIVGDIGVFIHAEREFAEIGFSLSSDCQGRGIATDAVTATLDLVFELTNVPRVIAITDDRNTPCIRLLERIGMRKVLTAPAQFRGEPCVEHTYELTALQRQRRPILPAST